MTVAPDRSRAALATLALAAVLVVAGCGAPVADDPARGRVPNVAVTNGTLSLDPGEVYAQIQTLQGTAVDPPTRVRAYNTLEGFQNQSADLGLAQSTTFRELAGMGTGPVNVSAIDQRAKNGYVTGLGAVVVYLGPNATAVDEHLLLAHELTHYLQAQTGRQQQAFGQVGFGTTDATFVVRALAEGGATFTTDAYLAAYVDTDTRNAAWYDRIAAQLPPGHVGRYGNGAYVHGHDYVAGRIDDPSRLASVWANPPRTGEQLLHGLEPGSEPPTPLPVATPAGDRWQAVGDDRLGEPFVRYALESELGADRAAAAAAGWGNDTLRIYRPVEGGDPSFVWVLGWDDPGNATEFQRAFRDALDARGDRAGGVWNLTDVDAHARLVDPTETTTAFVVGNESFVDSAGVSGSDTTITIRAG